MKYILCRAGFRQTKQKKNIHKHSLPPGLCGGNLLTTLRCPQRGLSNQLGKYWQLNQSNKYTSTYSRIQQTKNPYYVTIHNEYARENPRINRQNRRKVTFPGSAYPKEISQQYTPATHTEAVHCQGVLLGVFHPCLWPLKAPGSTLGEGRQTSHQPADASTPLWGWVCVPMWLSIW